MTLPAGYFTGAEMAGSTPRAEDNGPNRPTNLVAVIQKRPITVSLSFSPVENPTGPLEFGQGKGERRGLAAPGAGTGGTTAEPEQDTEQQGGRWQDAAVQCVKTGVAGGDGQQTSEKFSRHVNICAKSRLIGH